MASVQAPVSDSVIQAIRSQFPNLSSSTIFFENAGGSLMPRVVADAMRDYMVTRFVQLGATYKESIEATQTVADAHAWINTLMGGDGAGKTILGASASQLCRMLADCYLDIMEPGDEVIVCEAGHEANVNPWVRLERFGIKPVMWRIDPESMRCRIEDLERLLSDSTRVVAFPQVSNLLGEVVDVAEVTRVAQAAGARVVVDGVAYAPHRLMEAAEWGADWYVYSCYKVFGPHMGAMFGRDEAIEELTGHNHFFIPKDAFPSKFELGGVSHEGCAGLLAIGEYLKFVLEQIGESVPNGRIDRAGIEKAMNFLATLELPLQERLADFLAAHPRVRVIGPEATDESRVATISFVHESLLSTSIADAVAAEGIGIRAGHMYSYRLCQALGIDTSQGVARASMAHYNTVEEVDRLIEVLERIL
jgi:cysteine desulfurase family protein (TIGR01976 family)